MPIANRVGPIRPAIIFVVAMRTPQGLHSDSTVHPSTLEEFQYQSLPGPLWVQPRKSPSGLLCQLSPAADMPPQSASASAAGERRTAQIMAVQRAFCYALTTRR